MAGFRTAMQEAGLSADQIAFGDYKRESGYQAMKELLAKRNEKPFTAVYITSEMMTYGALQAIREAGLRVPEDLSIVGFDIHTVDDGEAFRLTHAMLSPA